MGIKGGYTRLAYPGEKSCILCDRVYYGKDLCFKHYQQKKKTGDPIGYPYERLGDKYHKGTYNSWHAMRQRCYNPSQVSYPNYGGRGITVCDRWLYSYLAFYEDMGLRPEGRSIDRIDVNGNYELGNCRWATKLEQDENKRPRRSR